MRIDDELVRIARGEVLGDSWSRQVYSVDASHYQLEPMAVILPVDEQDVQQACRYSHEKNVPITARGAGTGLLGQALSDGIVLDFTKHMNKILDIDDNYVVVQPGIVKGLLDKELEKRGKFLPPDPASSNYCTIGGMISDNSSGVHCLGYGNTIDFLEQINVVFADGELGSASSSGFDGRFEKLFQLLSPHLDAIRNGYPKVRKNSCGYRLDAVMSDKFMPQKAFAASEGTLGIVTSAKLRILDTPVYRCMIVLGFENLLQAVSAVPVILKFLPVALEMLDHSVYSHGRSRDGGCLLFVEFSGNSRKVDDCVQDCKEKLAGKCSILEYASDEQSMTQIWRSRKGALNDIMKLTVGSRRPIGLIEDTVVRPELLSDHVTNLLQIYQDNRLDYVMYGHVGDGNLHTRPLVDIVSAKEIDLIKKIANELFAKVIHSGGTITGEHGDGLARVGYIEMMYGREIVNLFCAVKKHFDPAFMMNPGKKVPVQ